MTTTVVYGNVPTSSPTDVSIYLMDQSKLKRKADNVSADGLNASAVFVYADGDPALSTRVTATRRDDPSKGVVNLTIRLETLQIVEVDSEVTEEAIAAATIGLTVPGTMEDADAALSFLGAAFSLFFDGVTSKVPNSGIIDSMNFGVLADLY
jgi:hypothetical protein